MFSIQKASAWNRISAAIFDLIMLLVVTVGVAFCLSAALGYQSYFDRLQARYTAIEEEYGVDFDIAFSEYENMPEDQKAQFIAADEAVRKDEEASYVYNMLFSLSLIILTFSILIAYLLLEFLVPLLLKNGQTLGKKVFSIAVMREDGVKVSALLLFVRTLLGKYTLETMLPVLIIVMLFFGITDIMGTMIILAIALIQIIMFLFSRTHAVIHDRLSHTLCVDINTQRIFETPEALMQYKNKLQAEKAEKAPY